MAQGTRLSVNLSLDTDAALRRVVQEEGVTITEAVRRLVSYGDLVYRAVKVNGQKMLLCDGDTTREVIVL